MISKQEQETIITFNEQDAQANVYTYNGSLKRRLASSAEFHPDQVKRIDSDQFGGVTYSIPKKWIKPNPPRILSEEQRAKLAVQLKSNLSRKS